MNKIIAGVSLALSYSTAVLSGTVSPKVLLFSKTQTSRNAVIPTAIAAVKQLGTERGWQVEATEDSEQFTDGNLRSYDVVVWLNTSGQILSSKQQAAYERFHRSGKGTVAVHSGGVDTELTQWPWYRRLASTEVNGERVIKELTVFNMDPTHPASFMWPQMRRETDEWYFFTFSSTETSLSQLGPSPDTHVLLVAYDPVFYPALFHPIAWYREFDGGRYFYTALGGTTESYTTNGPFLSHLANAIEWAGHKLPTHVARASDGAALILKEFDGVTPNGVWDAQSPSPYFKYEVTPGKLVMSDSSSVSIFNRHLVRRGLAIDSRRPYAIEGKFTFPEPIDVNKPYSFCVNLNVAGPDGDLGAVNTWSINVDLNGGNGAITKFMGFKNGGFFEIGELHNNWGSAETEYDFSIHVNAGLRGSFRPKMVSMVVRKAKDTLEEFETDYSTFPYQPDDSKPVRIGLNSHGTAWVLRNLKVYYLDIAQPNQS